jgi:hypothetical protein
MKHWFYVKTSSMTHTYVDGSTETLWPLASVMSNMAPLAKVNPPVERTPEREAYDRAFALACRYSEGRDLVEEMVASNFWPLGKRNGHFILRWSRFPYLVRRRGFLSRGSTEYCRQTKTRRPSSWRSKSVLAKLLAR